MDGFNLGEDNQIKSIEIKNGKLRFEVRSKSRAALFIAAKVLPLIMLLSRNRSVPSCDRGHATRTPAVNQGPRLERQAPVGARMQTKRGRKRRLARRLHQRGWPIDVRARPCIGSGSDGNKIIP